MRALSRIYVHPCTVIIIVLRTSPLCTGRRGLVRETNLHHAVYRTLSMHTVEQPRDHLDKQQQIGNALHLYLFVWSSNLRSILYK